MYVNTQRKCVVVLCGWVREGVGVSGAETCPSLQRIYPITAREWGPLSWRPGRRAVLKGGGGNLDRTGVTEGAWSNYWIQNTAVEI